jgi:hypothetical protein
MEEDMTVDTPKRTPAEIAESFARAAILIERANKLAGDGADMKWLEALFFLEERGDPEATHMLSGLPKD